jgi:hypothetical protein
VDQVLKVMPIVHHLSQLGLNHLELVLDIIKNDLAILWLILNHPLLEPYFPTIFLQFAL